MRICSVDLNSVAQLGVVRHLVDKAKPASDISCGFRGGEVSDGVQVLREWFYGSVRHSESS